MADNPNTEVPPSAAQASVPPATDYRHAVDRDYAISILMEMQRSLGKLEQAVSTLSSDICEVKKKVNAFEKVLYACAVLLAIFLVVGGWIANTTKDAWLVTYKASLEQVKQAPRPP